jgi:very-short-patch-repair endonuclease
MNTRQKAKISARLLRRKTTSAEEKFWHLARNRGLFNKKILRQHPLRYIHNGQERFFVADFYCAEAKLVIEIDGGIHEKQADYDNLRSYILECLGLCVIRVKNEDLENHSAVIERFGEYFRQRRANSPLLRSAPVSPLFVKERGPRGEFATETQA